MSSNSEMYRFEDFTFRNYWRILNLVIENKFTPVFFNEVHLGKPKPVLWRHDVEFSPVIALKMAESEYEMGVKSTYFFQLHSEFYNVFEKFNSEILYKIASLGHQIGLHFDAHYYGITSQHELNKYIKLDKTYLEAVFNIEIFAFSFHNTTPFILGCEDLKYGGLINVYSKYFKSNFSYCADSTGFWRYEILEDVLQDQFVPALQVLTHDAMWSEKVLSPRKRVFKSIDDHAEWLKHFYDRALEKFNAKNVDDQTI